MRTKDAVIQNVSNSFERCACCICFAQSDLGSQVILEEREVPTKHRKNGPPYKREER